MRKKIENPINKYLKYFSLLMQRSTYASSGFLGLYGNKLLILKSFSILFATNGILYNRQGHLRWLPMATIDRTVISYYFA